MNVKLRIIFAFCLSIAVLAVTGFYSYQSTGEYKSAAEWVSHTQNVIAEMASILSNTQAIESEQRGFVITGNPKYIVPFQQNVISEENSYRNLDALIQDNKTQHRLLDSLHMLITRKINFASDVIDARRHRDFDAAQQLVMTDRGQDLMDSIRDLSDRFIIHERELLSERLIEEKNNFSNTVFIVVISIVIAIVIVLVTMYFFIMDYNRRIRSERQVQESESRLKKFMEMLPIGVYILRPDRSSYFENIKFRKFFARDKDPNHSYPAYYQGTDVKYPPEKFAIVRALQGEKNIFIEDLEIDREGVRIPLRINATAVTNDKDEIEYVIVVVEDISDIKQTEHKLIDAKKIAEESAMLKEAFLANMSHEIRTPMNAIIGFTDLLMKRNLQPQELEYVQTIKSSGENLMRIINDILDVSKIDSGMMTFEEHPINIAELFNSIHTMMAEKARVKGLTLTFESGPDIPDTLLGDPTRLTQIIINLVGNAIKFTRHGAVSVDARLLAEDTAQCHIEFAVRDTGIGIPADKINTIFERFRQAEAHTTRNYGGTGLGLSIAKQLVELQGGQIHIKSVVGMGSVFTFDLVFKRSKQARSDKKRQSGETLDTARLSRLKILLAEDNPVNIKFIESLFSEYGMKADVAENGRIATEKLRAQEYDIVLMDMEMPEMSGYEATAVIRNEIKSAVPIIAMTAHAMSGEREKCLQLGMNEYISKPIKADLLFEKMLALTEAPVILPATTESASGPIINLDFLVRSMRGNTQAIRETIEIFYAQVNEDMSALQQGMEKADHKEIKAYAHRMKSTVSLMGIAAMVDILEKMESLASTGGDMIALHALFSELCAYNAQAIREIETEKLKYSV